MSQSQSDCSAESNQTSETSKDANKNSCIDRKKKLESSDSSIGNGSSNSKVSNSMKTRIVCSRYKQAAVEKYKPKTNKSSDGSGIGNLSSPLSSSSDSRRNARPLNRNAILKKKGFSASIGNLTQPKFSLPNKLEVPQNVRKHPNSSVLSQRKLVNIKNDVDLGLSNPKLHSTALHNNTFFDQTRVSSTDLFSTTVVEGQKYLHSNHETPGRLLSVELSDISEIHPMSTSKGSQDGEMTVISLSNEKVEEKSVDKEDYTQEEINAEYLRYLTWAVVDINSTYAYKRQVDEAQKQLLFLSTLVEEQQEALFEETKLLELIECHDNICRKHEMLKDQLSKCVETLPNCTNALETLSHHLEFQSNQVKLENIYIPLDEDSYREQLNDALKENCDLLKQLNLCLEPQKERMGNLADLLIDLNKVIEEVEPCISEVEKTAGHALQESSLKLTLESRH